MRKIKFRAWDKTNKKMLEVDGINFNKFGFQQFKDAGIVCNLPDTEISQILRLSEVELMQYIGMKDENDSEIFEGDIVEITDDGMDRATGGMGVIVFSCGQFYIYDALGNTSYWRLMDYKLKKRGNTYENPIGW